MKSISQKTIRIAVAQPADFHPWLALATEVEPLFGPLVEDQTFIRALRKNIHRGTAFCVRENDGPPGDDLLAGMLFSMKPPQYTIGWLAVAESARRQGVGRRLVEHAIHLIQPPDELVVETFGPGDPGGQAARQFYLSLGFQPCEKVPAPEGSPQKFHQVFRRFFP